MLVHEEAVGSNFTAGFSDDLAFADEEIGSNFTTGVTNDLAFVDEGMGSNFTDAAVDDNEMGDFTAATNFANDSAWVDGGSNFTVDSFTLDVLDCFSHHVSGDEMMLK